MIQIKPEVRVEATCRHCGHRLESRGLLWQGMHICFRMTCQGCRHEILEDLRVGHAVSFPYQIDVSEGCFRRLDPRRDADSWLGKPLLESVLHPRDEALTITREILKPAARVVILNCLDFLYGHCLLKLLNAERHLIGQSELGLIVIIPKLLRWMVPEGAAEVWTVDLPLQKAQGYYLDFERFVEEQLPRFEQVFLSEAHSHPSRFDLSSFTRVSHLPNEQTPDTVCFIWREDRLWCNTLAGKLLRRLGLSYWLIALQNRRVRVLFERMRRRRPELRFAVAGLGTKTAFPAWIEDHRVARFDKENELRLCELYAKCRLVIGLHGSNMLLPSGHANMTLDLMPEDRWGNFAQDVLYQEQDPRLAAFRYRYLPAETGLKALAFIATTMLRQYEWFREVMAADQQMKGSLDVETIEILGAPASFPIEGLQVSLPAQSPVTRSPAEAGRGPFHGFPGGSEPL